LRPEEECQNRGNRPSIDGVPLAWWTPRLRPESATLRLGKSSPSTCAGPGFGTGNTKLYEVFGPDRRNLVLRGNLIAVGKEDGEFSANVRRRNNDVVAVIWGETAYFLPEHSPGPLLRNRGEELWIEATIPRKGPPRPIRLAIKRDGVLNPLAADSEGPDQPPNYFTMTSPVILGWMEQK